MPIEKKSLSTGLTSWIQRQGSPFGGARKGYDYYVDSTNGSDNWDGLNGWDDDPLASIGQALTNIGTRKFCRIFVAPGDYLISAVLNANVEGTQILGPGDAFRNVAMVYASSTAHHLMTINNHHIEIDGIAFSSATDAYDGIQVSPASSSYKVKISNCRLDGWSGEYGIKCAGDSPDLVVMHNLLRSWNTAAIYSNATRGNYIENIIHVVSSKTGIDHIPNGGNRPDNVYLNNQFSGVTNSTTTGIKMTGTPTNGTCIMSGNMFHGSFDVTITQTAATVATENYASSNAGGALVDATTYS
jgi:hypothetical protein